MSRTLSSNSFRAVALGTALGLMLAACAHQLATAPAAVPVRGVGKVGFVRMDDLVKKHPLYGELAHLDEDLQALQLRSVGSEVARSTADIGKQERALQNALELAEDQTKKTLAGKQHEYAKAEQAAIAAALGAAGAAGGPGGTTIAANMSAVSRAQAAGAARAAQANLAAYRQQLIDQDNAATRTLERSLEERAARSYRARADQLQKKEADYAYQLASNDSAQRLTLRTKLTNLALDDNGRADVKKQLDALDQTEADALGAMRNRDQATLVALQKQLHEQLAAELRSEIADLRTRTIANINRRTLDTRNALVGGLAELPPASAGTNIPAGVAPNLRAKLLLLHQKYTNDFNKDAATTVAQFQKTRADLTKRFEELTGADGAAQASAGKEMTLLQQQRLNLYEEMVAQIDREVKTIAAKRGVSIVVSDVLAPANGVDLTADAEKNIESLHE